MLLNKVLGNKSKTKGKKLLETREEGTETRHKT